MCAYKMKEKSKTAKDESDSVTINSDSLRVRQKLTHRN